MQGNGREWGVSLYLAIVGLGALALLAWQPAPPPPRPPHPPPPKPRPVEDRLIEIRQRLAREQPADAATAQERLLVEWTERFLSRAEAAVNQANRPVADRLADAADACRRPLDHLAHLQRKGPPSPPPPGPGNAGDHLQQVYFRLRLASYFLQQIPAAPSAQPLLALAQQFYQNGVRAQESGDARAADEFAKAADDLTHALENTAQAAALP